MFDQHLGRRAALLSLGVAATALIGCASSPLDASWTDPSQTPRSLRGAAVLVVCEADEAVVRQLCQDKVAAELRSRGVNTAVPPPAAQVRPEQWAQEAREVNAAVIFLTRIAPDFNRDPGWGGPNISFGLGMGGGFGRHGFGGVGISAPIGGGGYRSVQGLVANASIIDAPSGRLHWTGRASTYRSDDLRWQVESLGTSVVAGAQRAGFL